MNSAVSQFLGVYKDRAENPGLPPVKSIPFDEKGVICIIRLSWKERFKALFSNHLWRTIKPNFTTKQEILAKKTLELSHEIGLLQGKVTELHVENRSLQTEIDELKANL